MRKRTPRPKEGDLHVWNIINPPNEGDRYPVTDSNHAKRLIRALAESQLLQDWIDCNAFGLEVFKDGEWEEWEDEDYNDIDSLMREEDILEQGKNIISKI